MVGNYTRFLGPLSSAGLPIGVTLPASTRIPTTSAPDIPGREAQDPGGARKRAVKEVASVQGQFISRMFLVPKKDGSWRPLVNLQNLNLFLQHQHFKMEGISHVKDLL
jgi:hypothetical protein